MLYVWRNRGNGVPYRLLHPAALDTTKSNGIGKHYRTVHFAYVL